MSIDKSVYYHSAERYNNSFALTRLVYWGRIHNRACRKLGMPSLLLMQD